MHEDDPDLDDDWADDDEDESDVVSCPECGADVYEDAEQCPACGQYIVHGTSPWRGRPRWWILLGLAGIAAVLWLSVPWPVRQGVPPAARTPGRDGR
jgi:hypothetical protein